MKTYSNTEDGFVSLVDSLTITELRKVSSALRTARIHAQQELKKYQSSLCSRIESVDSDTNKMPSF